MTKRNLMARNKTTSLKSMMRKKSSSRLASKKTKVWENVHHEKQFWVNDGNVLKNLKELPGALRNMNNETFLHHVNEQKNDFANWIEDVIGEKNLADEVRTLQSKNAVVKAVRKIF